MNTENIKVLVVDDEVQIRRLLKVTLQAKGFKLHEASSGRVGIQLAATEQPDIILLDLGLPDMEGIQVLRDIREWTQLPIIVLTARDMEDSKITALNNGADDYVTKPFGMGELIARIHVALRHANRTEKEEPVLKFGNLVVDLVRRSVTLCGEVVKLTPTEYDLLKVLAVNSGRVVTHRQLLHEVWGHHYQQEAHYPRIYVGQLRKKLEDDPARPRFIVTEPGIGCRFMPMTERE